MNAIMPIYQGLIKDAMYIFTLKWIIHSEMKLKAWVSLLSNYCVIWLLFSMYQLILDDPQGLPFVFQIFVGQAMGT